MDDREFNHSNLALPMVVKRMTQSWAARQLGIDDAKLTKILKRKLSLETIDSNNIDAFMSDYVGLDKLGPASARRAAKITASDEGHLELALLAEAALRSPLSDDERWTYHRVAARSRLNYGATYEENPEEKTGAIALSEDDVAAAEKHFLEQRKLKACFSAAAWPAVDLGVRMNLCAINMLREKNRDAISSSSQAREQYRELLSDAILEHKKAAWPDPKPHEEAGPIEATQRLVIVSIGAAIAELSVEAGDPAAARDVFQTVLNVLGSQYDSLLQIVFIDDAWAHNQAVLRQALAGQPVPHAELCEP